MNPAVALCLLGLTCSCTRLKAERPLVAAVDEGARESEPVGAWSYHPLDRVPALDRLELGSGSRLEVDEAGSRWLVKLGQEPQSAAFGAPEALVAVRANDPASGVPAKYFALGQSGALYFFQQPLGEFTAVRTPPENYHRSALQGDSIVAVSRSGQLLRSDDWGRSFQLRNNEQFYVGAFALPEGDLLAYSVPEQWHQSSDRGSTFRRLDVPAIGPLSVEQAPDGRLSVTGLYARFTFAGGAFHRKKRHTPVSGHALPPYARGSMLADGHGALFEDRFFSISAHADDQWILHQGPLDGPLRPRMIPAPPACDRFRLLASSSHLALLCQKELLERSPPVKVYLASHSERSFRKWPHRLRGDFEHIVSAMSKDRLALSGVCLREEAEAGCTPRGVVILSPKQSQLFDLPGVETASALTFSSTALWALGRRKKGGDVMLFGPMSKSPVVRGQNLTNEWGVTGLPTAQKMALAAGAGAAVVVSASRSADTVLLSFDGQGKHLGSGLVPRQCQSLDGAGRRWAALDVEHGVLWESATYGLSWTKSLLPRLLCKKEADCEPRLRCSGAGCIVGDELIRLGWGPDRSSSESALSLRADDWSNRPTAPGFVCRLSGPEWQAIEGLSSVPGARDAALGDAAWVAAQSFPSTASATSVYARWGQPELVYTPLLPAVAHPDEYAYALHPQVEGSAVIRYRVPPANGQSTDIELAWDNRISGTLARSKFTHSGELSELRSSSRWASSRRAEPAILSVAGPGLYLSLSEPDRDTQFFRPDGSVESVPEVSWPSLAHLSTWIGQRDTSVSERQERVFVDGMHGALLQLAGGRLVVRASAAGGKAAPFLMGLVGQDTDRAAQGVNIAYRGQQVGMVSMQIDLRGDQHHAAFVPFVGAVGFGAPQPVPLQANLPPSPRTCTKEERATSVRVVAPAFSGPMRGATILGMDGAPMSLKTTSAVLFGTVSQPCVSTWELVESEPEAGSVRYRALVFPDSAQSWLFRMDGEADGGRTISTRSMTCAQASDETD